MIKRNSFIKVSCPVNETAPALPLFVVFAHELRWGLGKTLPSIDVLGVCWKWRGCGKAP